MPTSTLDTSIGVRRVKTLMVSKVLLRADYSENNWCRIRMAVKVKMPVKMVGADWCGTPAPVNADGV